MCYVTLHGERIRFEKDLFDFKNLNQDIKKLLNLFLKLK